MLRRTPTKGTLDRYGLTLEEWVGHLGLTVEEWQAGAPAPCPVCKREPPSGRYVTDHEHVRGWKDKPKDERRLFVRGVVCTVCNHYILTRYGTPAKHRGAADYLERYENKKRGRYGG